MPNVLVHTLFAERALEHWRTSGAMAPFDPGDDQCRNAFVHGALGPDLGYFPGGDALLSELAHRLRSGRMAGMLLGTARSDLQIAYSWGWLTHYLADVRVHPLVDAYSPRAEHTDDDRAQSMWNGSRTPLDLAHVRVEVGLDAVFLMRYPIVARRLRPAFSAGGLDFLAAAFEDVYGPVTTPRELHAAHLSVVRWQRCLIPLVRWMSADWSNDGTGPGGVAAPLLRSGEGHWLRHVGVGPVAAAFVSPLRPSPDLIERVSAELETFPRLIESMVETPGTMPDLDMEDGRAILEASPKEATAQTMVALEIRTWEQEARATSISRFVRRGGRSRRTYRSETPRNPITKETPMSRMRSTP